jgi:hypothetical protein
VTDKPTVPALLSPEQVVAAYRQTGITPMRVDTLVQRYGKWCGCAIGAAAAKVLLDSGEPIRTLSTVEAIQLLERATGQPMPGGYAYAIGFDNGDYSQPTQEEAFRRNAAAKLMEWVEVGKATLLAVNEQLGKVASL